MIESSHRVPTAVLAAWERSPLRQVSPAVRDELLGDAMTVTVPPGRALYGEYHSPRIGLILQGQVRVQALAPDGRTATIRYAGPGELVGVAAVVAESSPATAKALTECEIVVLSVPRLRRLMHADPTLALVLLREVTDLLFQAVDLLTANLFGSVRERLSRHLLDLAERTPDGLVVRADQATIAESIGSVREVVARALRSLREDGVVGRQGNQLVILDRERLTKASAGA